MNQFNDINGDKQNEPLREWNIKPPVANFKPRNYPYNTSPVVSAIMGRLNNHSIDNGDVKVHTNIFQLNLSLNQFQIHAPTQLNQFMMIKLVI